MDEGSLFILAENCWILTLDLVQVGDGQLTSVGTTGAKIAAMVYCVDVGWILYPTFSIIISWYDDESDQGRSQEFGTEGQKRGSGGRKSPSGVQGQSPGGGGDKC